MGVKGVSAWGPGKDESARIFPKKKKHTTDSSRTAFKKSGFQVNLISDEKLKMQIMKQEPATVF